MDFNTDLTIPSECSNYKIVISSNLAELVCKAGLATKLLSKKQVDKHIDHTIQQVKFITRFTEDESYIYNYLLDRADLNIEELFNAIASANALFHEYEITCKSLTAIDRYISGLSRYNRTWLGLTTKPDYNLTLFVNRILPYFSLDCMDWVKANIDAMASDYPAELLQAKKQNDLSKGIDKDAYHEEISLATKNNNFLEWQVLAVDKYPDIELLVKNIRLLLNIGLKRQATIMICKLMLSPRECHIIKHPMIWEILKPDLENKDFSILIKYCMYYAMYILKQEETIMFSQISMKSRVLFSLEEASSLPTFDGCHIEKSPYIIQLTNDTPIGRTMMFYLQGDRRINSKKEFNRRLRIATGGAFNGVDFKSIGAAITGSILIPCVQCSPLEDRFSEVEWDRTRPNIPVKYPYMIDTPSKEDLAFINYLEYYYPSYVSLSDEDYKKQVLNIGNKLGDHEKVIDETQNVPDDIEYETTPFDSTKIFGGVVKTNDELETMQDSVQEMLEPAIEQASTKEPKQTIKSRKNLKEASITEKNCPLDADVENKSIRNSTE